MFQPTALTGTLTCATIKCLSKALLYHIPLWPAGG